MLCIVQSVTIGSVCILHKHELEDDNIKVIQKLLCCSGLILPKQNDAKKLKMIGTLPNRYSSESTQQDLSNEYQHDRI